MLPACIWFRCFSMLTGTMTVTSPLWIVVVPAIAGLFLAITGLLLIWDLEHPERFYLIFTRPQWRSWLVKGAVVITGYGAVLLLHYVLAFRGSSGPILALAIVGLPLAAMTAIYTAYLFAQARARDLWQNPLLPPHLLIQAIVAGAAVLLPMAAITDDEQVAPLLWVLGAGSLIHLLLVWGETTLGHPTAHARLATWEMVHGRYKRYFWASAAAMIGATFAPFIGYAAPPLALIGLMAYEHAYVQGGQAVPLA